jgi:hypothetical protein
LQDVYTVPKGEVQIYWLEINIPSEEAPVA